MATQVNRKLLFFVLAATVVTVGTVGFVLVLQYRADATRHIRRGDAALAEGDAKAAVSYYGRAIGKKPNNTDYYAKYLEAMRAIVPPTAEEARERYQQYMSALVKRAQAGRDDLPLWEPVFEEFRYQAAVTDSPSNWLVLAGMCDDAAAVLASDDPLVPTFAVMKGFANARRVRGLAPEEARVAEEALKANRGAVTGAYRDLAYAGLLRIQLDRGRRLDGSGQGSMSREALAEFDRTLAEAKSGDIGVETLSAELARLSLDPVANRGALEQGASRLVEAVLASDNPRACLDAVKTVASLPEPDALRKATDLLEAYLAKHPEAIVHRRAYAFCLQSIDPASAEAEARRVIETPALPVSLESAAQQDVRILAAQQLFDAEFARIGTLEDPEQVKEGLDRLGKARDRIAEEVRGAADDSSLVKADGKVLLARGDDGAALVKFNEVIRRGTLQDLDLYVSAAIAAIRTRQLGLAVQHVDRGLEMTGANPDLLELKVRVELELGRYPQAAATAEGLVARSPERESAKQLLEIARAGIQGNLALDDKDPVIVAMKGAEEAYQRKEFVTARAVMVPLLESHPNDVRVYRTLAQIEAADGNIAACVDYADRGLRLVPNDSYLVRLKAFSQSDDPAARVLTIVEEIHRQDPERSVFSYIRLADAARATAADADRRGDASPEETARLRTATDRLRAAAAEWKVKAEAAGPEHPALIEFTFNEAVRAADWTTAEAIAARAARITREPALGPTLRARLQIERGDPRGATVTLQQAVAGNIDSAEIWRLLGYAHEQLGELAEANRAFGAAYERRPTDLGTIRLYVPMLARAGDRQKALEILREARRIAPNDEELNDLWLGLETEIGDRRLARTIREARYRVLPKERRNALALAQMYARTAPDRLDVTFGDKPKYGEAEWRAATEEVRTRELNRVQREWFERCDKIFRETLEADPRNIEVALAYAGVLRQQGRDADAEKTVNGVLASAGAEATPQIWIAVGVNRRESGDVAGAERAFEEAIRLQDDTQRNADVAIGEYHFQRADWASAADRYDRALERQATVRNLLLRAAEANVKARRFDRGRELLASAASIEPGRDTVLVMLEGNLEESQGDVFLETGRNPEALATYAKAAEVLDRAFSSAPVAARAVILTQQANIFRKSYLAGGGEDMLDRSLAAVDRAVAMRGDYWPAADSRFETLAGRGDMPAALAELDRYVRAAPSHFPSRQKLLRTLMGMGNTAQAAEVANAAIASFPTSAEWRMALADVEMLRGRPDLAIAAMLEADRLSPDPALLERLVETQMRIEKPNWAGLVTVLRERSADVRNSPFLQACLGVCLLKTGDQRRGVESIREGFLKAAREEEAGSGATLDAIFRILFLQYPADRIGELETLVAGFRGGALRARDWRWIGDAWLAKGEAGYRDAITAFDKAAAADDGRDPVLSAGILNGLGSAQYLGGFCTDALGSFEKALEKDPTDPAVLNNLAYLCGECGNDPARGVPYAIRAVRLAPTVADYYDTLGSLFYAVGNDKDAQEVLLRSLRFRPTASANYHIAQVLARQGRKDEARNYLRTALELRPISTLEQKINTLLSELK